MPEFVMVGFEPTGDAWLDGMLTEMVNESIWHWRDEVVPKLRERDPIEFAAFACQTCVGVGWIPGDPPAPCSECGGNGWAPEKEQSRIV